MRGKGVIGKDRRLGHSYIKAHANEKMVAG